MREDLLAAATILAALTVLSFVLIYAFQPWWRSTMGRSIMTVALATLMLAIAGVAKRVDERSFSIDWWVNFPPYVTVAWLAIAGVYGYRILIVLRGHKDDDDDESDVAGGGPLP